jgi:dipeptidyl aminopeptidase/acylaminoacyl peptidase
MKFKKILLFILIFVVVTTLLSPIAGIIVYNSIFSRVERPNYDLTPGLVDFEEVKEKHNISRELFSIKSNKETLQGYYYTNDDPKGLIVMSHGLNDGADGLLAITLFFINNGYNVFSYDGTGCYSSSGNSCNGFSQSLIDLENVLYFLNEQPKFSSQKKLLFGYSWGGYASTSIFNLIDENIYGSVAVSAYYDAKNLIYNKGKEYVGFLATLGKPVLDMIIKNRFKEYVNYDSISGINKTSTPFYIIHGTKDSTISHDKYAIISQKDKITNPNVTYKSVNDKDHVSILYSSNAIAYQKQVKENLDNIKKKNKEEIKEYILTVDDELYSELDIDLFNSIISFYHSCLSIV